MAFCCVAVCCWPPFRLLPFQRQVGLLPPCAALRQAVPVRHASRLQTFGFCLASCFRISIRRGCFLYRYRHAHSDKVSLSRMVAGNEILLFYFRTDNQFGFHTVGTVFAVAGSRFHCPASCVAIDIKRRTPSNWALFFDTLQQAGKALCHSHSKAHRTYLPLARSGRCRSCLLSAAPSPEATAVSAVRS